MLCTKEDRFCFVVLEVSLSQYRIVLLNLKHDFQNSQLCGLLGWLFYSEPNFRNLLLTCASISCRLICVRVMLEKSIVSAHRPQIIFKPTLDILYYDPSNFPLDMTLSPVSSIWDFPDLVEATTAAVACVTPRDACCRWCRLALSLSAFTWRRQTEFEISCNATTTRKIWGFKIDFRLFFPPLDSTGGVKTVWSLLTFEAATSCAVLAAISCEHTINSSNFPLPCTTRSAASLEQHNTK